MGPLYFAFMMLFADYYFFSLRLSPSIISPPCPLFSRYFDITPLMPCHHVDYAFIAFHMPFS